MGLICTFRTSFTPSVRDCETYQIFKPHYFLSYREHFYLPAILISPRQVSDHLLPPFERKIISISFDNPSSVMYLPLAPAEPPPPLRSPLSLPISPHTHTHTRQLALCFCSAVVETPDTVPVLWATANILVRCAGIHCTYGFCDGNAWTKTDEYRGRFRSCRHPSRVFHAFQFNLLTL